MSDHALPVPASRDEALRALSTRDAEVRRLVVRALERAPADAAREVLPLVLGDEDWRVRKEGIQLAHAIAERADVVPVLVDVLRGSTEHVALRNAAVEALSGLGPLSVPAVEDALLGGELDADGRKLAVDVLAGARLPRSIDALVRALEDDDPNVRAAAAEALGLLGGEPAVQALLALLARDDRFLRLVALEGLNRLGALVPLATLEAFLGDRILRHAAVAALGRALEEEAIDLLVTAVDDPSRHVGETALRALGERLREEPSLADRARARAIQLGAAARSRVLSSALGDDPHLRRAALPVLALLADPSAGEETEALVRALRDPDVAEDAEAALQSLGASVFPTLVEVARRGDVGSRAAVLGILPRVARDREDAIQAIRAALHDRDPDVVAAAAAAFASALAADVSPDAADVHALLRVASGRDAARGSSVARAAAVALQCLRTLARVRPDAVRPHLVHVDEGSSEAAVVCALLAVAGGPEHVPWLSRAATAPSPRTRRAAVEALGHIGSADAAVALGFAITDETEEVALAAIKALGRAKGVGATPLLRLIDAGGDEALAAAAVRALGSTGDPRAVAPLRARTSASSVAIACAALEALSELGVDDLADVAASALAHPSSVVARTALDVLDAALHGGAPAAIAASLSPALEHASWEVRRRAVELLARLDPFDARPLLAARAGLEAETVVREAIDRALADLDRRVARPSRPPPSLPPGGHDE